MAVISLSPKLLILPGSHSPGLVFAPAERRYAPLLCRSGIAYEFFYHWSPRWASVNTETHPGSVPQSGFGFSIGTNIWLLTGLTVTAWALVPVGKWRRSITRIEESAQTSAFKAKMQSEAAQKIYHQRSQIAEFPHAWIKERCAVGNFAVEGKKKGHGSYVGLP